MVEVEKRYIVIGGIVTLIATCQLVYFAYRASLGDSLPQHRGELPHGHDTHDFHGHVVAHRREAMKDDLLKVESLLAGGGGRGDGGGEMEHEDPLGQVEPAADDHAGHEEGVDAGEVEHGDELSGDEGGGEATEEEAATAGAESVTSDKPISDGWGGDVEESSGDAEDKGNQHDEDQHAEAGTEGGSTGGIGGEKGGGEDEHAGASSAWATLSAAGKELSSAMGLKHPAPHSSHSSAAASRGGGGGGGGRPAPHRAQHLVASANAAAALAAGGRGGAGLARPDSGQSAAVEAAKSAARAAVAAAQERASQVSVPPEKKHRKVKTHKGNLTCGITMNQASMPSLGRDLMTPWRLPRSRQYRSLGKVTPDLMRVLPEGDVLSGVRFKTCAVVGSAGLLLRWEMGREIDKHDAVFRFNIAPARGFERHVGSKTTIRLVNRMHFGFRESPGEVCLQHVTTPEIMKNYIALKRRHPGMRTYAIDMSFYEQVINWRRVQQPTNGYFGLRLALMLCDHVDIYGFLRTWQGWVPYHYFNEEEPNKQQMARDNQGEMPIIERLLKQNKDRMTFRHPCIVDKECATCPPGAHCHGQAPYPVPRPGYCQKSVKEECYVKCPEGTERNCPGAHGGRHGGAGTCPNHLPGITGLPCAA